MSDERKPPEEQQIEKAGERPPESIVRGQAVDPLEVIEARSRFWGRMLAAAVQATQPSDWIAMGDRPYLQAGGCDVVARRLAISFTNTRWERENLSDDEGTFFIIHYYGRVSMPGDFDHFDAHGTASSREDFLGTGVDSDEKKAKALSEINQGNLIKKARTNCMGNGIRELTALKAATWEMLAPFGITPERTGKVNFRAGAKGGGTGRANSLVDEPLKYGKQKGKTPRELSAKELAWYLTGWKEDLGNEEKEKYWPRTRKLIAEVEAMLAEREKGPAAKGAEGKAPPPAGSGTSAGATPYQAWMALAQEKYHLSEGSARQFVKEEFPEVKYPRDMTAAMVEKLTGILDEEERKLTGDAREEPL